MTSQSAITAQDIRKSFGSGRGLNGVSLAVGKGEIVCVLGPNGAGKTTLVRVLTTALSLQSGAAWVQGIDVCEEPSRVRRVIGVSGQFSAIDALLTARENLEVVSRFSGLSRHRARARAGDLLTTFDLVDYEDTRAKAMSGGVRRRLDIACSLVSEPEVLFLDEPTTGLDPFSRLKMWDLVRDLASQGMAVLLTTQYLEEAEYLADRVLFMRNGVVVADGTVVDLKAAAGSSTVTIQLGSDSESDLAAERLRRSRYARRVSVPGSRTVTVELPGGKIEAVAVINDLLAQGLIVSDFSIDQPSLDDVFFQLSKAGV